MEDWGRSRGQRKSCDRNRQKKPQTLALEKAAREMLKEKQNIESREQRGSGDAEWK